MRGTLGIRLAVSASAAIVAGVLLALPAAANHGPPHVELQDSTQGCNGVLPSSGGNTQMRVVGGTMTPGGTAVFEISYPLNPSSVGKEFTILDCAYINDVATLKYIVSFVPSNASFVLRMTLAVPATRPLVALYCNYVKTTGSPTASQASQRKAGPACFVIRAPQGRPRRPVSRAGRVSRASPASRQIRATRAVRGRPEDRSSCPIRRCPGRPAPLLSAGVPSPLDGIRVGASRVDGNVLVVRLVDGTYLSSGSRPHP